MAYGNVSIFLAHFWPIGKQWGLMHVRVAQAEATVFQGNWFTTCPIQMIFLLQKYTRPTGWIGDAGLEL